MLTPKIKSNIVSFCIFTILLSVFGWKTIENNWITDKHNGYNLNYTSADIKNANEYKKLIDNGMNNAIKFFDSPYKNGLDVFVHPSRQSLDSTWQKDWKMPTFQSECWMVASGVSKRLDMISPKLWDTESCEHKYAESEKTQQIITHELIHVYHGQLNFSEDFSNTDGIDWFVEGLATYASGQCDESRLAEVKKAITDNKIPTNLDKFWTGKIKYGLSGSVVMYIDKKYGRKKLIELLPFNKKSEIFMALETNEKDFLKAWKSFIQNK